MSGSFHFKQFAIQQKTNPQKVGTDSMLLGAWVQGSFSTILDIGTGTGILALMLAQKNLNATITAIEPDFNSFNEAVLNFDNSIFSSKINPINCFLQDYTPSKKFDLIISNPPYFENSTLSKNSAKNRARHTNELPIHELYEHVNKLLKENGKFALVIPYQDEEKHLLNGSKEGLFPEKILRTTRSNKTYKRSLILFSKRESLHAKVDSMLVKNEKNIYSKEYIEITKAFYAKDLSLKSN